MQKTLNNLFKLSHKVTIYVPSTVDVNKKTSNKKQVDKMLTEFSQMFGGATSTKALGCWTTEAGKLVKESVTLVYSYCNDIQLESNIQAVIKLAEDLKVEMNQEAISLEVNGDLHFI